MLNWLNNHTVIMQASCQCTAIIYAGYGPTLDAELR